MRFEVTILGNGSAAPALGRHQTAQVVNVSEQRFLIDCGEGVRQNLMRAGVSPMQIRAVFVSHIHGDHIFGLMPLISSLGLAGKQTPLPIFGPPMLGRMLDFFQHEFGLQLSFDIEFTPVDPTSHRLIFENRTVEVWSVPLRHRTPTSGFLFREKIADSPLCDQIGAKDTPLSPQRSYAYLSDTLPSPKAAELVRGVDLMYHEATFAQADSRLARQTGHSTTVQAARIAVKAEAGELILGHFSSRYKDLTALEAEAQAVFANSHIAHEGATFAIKPRIV